MTSARSNASKRPVWLSILLVIVAAAGTWWGKQHSLPAPPNGPSSGEVVRRDQGRGEVPTRSAPQAADDLLAAIRERRSYAIVQSRGEVIKLLPDDNEGARHQKFLVRLAGGETVLIAHNLDLADRLPVRERDTIEFKGEYIWNDRGGVVHWTHHDPAKRHEAGWVRVGGKTYD